MNSLILFSLPFRRFVTKPERIGFMFSMFLMSVVVLVLTLSVPAARAQDDDDDGEIPLDVVNIFFELNNTDGDLGIHALIDGEPWRKLIIEDLNGKRILMVRNWGSLGMQGLTELFFESAEPTFDELSAEEFFERFPEGTYEVEGITLEGEELEGEAEVSHQMPAPPSGIEVNGEATPEPTEENPEICEEDSGPEVSLPVTISWDAVTTSHPELGSPTDDPGIIIEAYQVVVEREEGDPLKLTFDLPPGTTSVDIPEGLLEEGDELKLEILVRESSGNQTATETCFEIEE